MAGIGTTQRATAVPSPVSTEGVLLTYPGTGGDSANPSLAQVPPQGNVVNNKISGVMNYTAGTGTTAVVLRCRRGALAGAQVGTSQTVTLAAGASDNIPYEFQDAGAAPNVGYVITIQQTGGTAAGTCNEIVGDVTDYI